MPAFKPSRQYNCDLFTLKCKFIQRTSLSFVSYHVVLSKINIYHCLNLSVTRVENIKLCSVIYNVSTISLQKNSPASQLSKRTMRTKFPSNTRWTQDFLRQFVYHFMGYFLFPKTSFGKRVTFHSTTKEPENVEVHHIFSPKSELWLRSCAGWTQRIFFAVASNFILPLQVGKTKIFSHTQCPSESFIGFGVVSHLGNFFFDMQVIFIRHFKITRCVNSLTRCKTCLRVDGSAALEYLLISSNDFPR